MSWEQQKQDKAAGVKPIPQLSNEEMQAMIERTRSK